MYLCFILCFCYNFAIELDGFRTDKSMCFNLLFFVAFFQNFKIKHNELNKWSLFVAYCIRYHQCGCARRQECVIQWGFQVLRQQENLRGHRGSSQETRQLLLFFFSNYTQMSFVCWISFADFFRAYLDAEDTWCSWRQIVKIHFLYYFSFEKKIAKFCKFFPKKHRNCLNIALNTL